ncbi:hypothetical protein ABT154_15695 [Streptomyces sp. NPDC001728]|uniref:hypothetical protein n=1 Tax=Streptomyces sp. NPDC001728 TaxID=3154396 RepID=UPI00331A9782
MRAQGIKVLDDAGLTRAQAAEIIDTGALPASLRSTLYGAVEDERRRPGASRTDVMDEAVLDALETLDVVAVVGPTPAPSFVSGSDKGKGRDEPANHDEGSGKDARERPVQPGSTPASNPRGVEASDDGYSYGDALGRLVEAINPFQRWSAPLANMPPRDRGAGAGRGARS